MAETGPAGVGAGAANVGPVGNGLGAGSEPVVVGAVVVVVPPHEPSAQLPHEPPVQVPVVQLSVQPVSQGLQPPKQWSRLKWGMHSPAVVGGHTGQNGLKALYCL
jgi:hypothetical protein